MKQIYRLGIFACFLHVLYRVISANLSRDVGDFFAQFPHWSEVDSKSFCYYKAGIFTVRFFRLLAYPLARSLLTSPQSVANKIYLLRIFKITTTTTINIVITAKSCGSFVKARLSAVHQGTQPHSPDILGASGR